MSRRGRDGCCISPWWHYVVLAAVLNTWVKGKPGWFSVVVNSLRPLKGVLCFGGLLTVAGSLIFTRQGLFALILVVVVLLC